jgi:hypothetical protein
MNNEDNLVQSQANNSNVNLISKYVYTPIYLQIILLIIHSYPEYASVNINGNAIVKKLLPMISRFRCDYELARLIIGISDILCQKTLN